VNPARGIGGEAQAGVNASAEQQARKGLRVAADHTDVPNVVHIRRADFPPVATTLPGER
jgi:hypothetical protein